MKRQADDIRVALQLDKQRGHVRHVRFVGHRREAIPANHSVNLLLSPALKVRPLGHVHHGPSESAHELK